MILAAGRGQRLQPLTDARPKALMEVNGETLIERHVTRLGKAGFSQVVINIAWLGSQISRLLGNGDQLGVSIHYSDEEDGALETGGGIHRVLPWFDEEPFLVVNADIWTDMDFSELTKAPGDLAHLVLVPVPEEKDQGDFDLAEGRVLNESPVNQLRPLTFSGIGIYHPKLFDGCESGAFPLAPLLRSAAGEGVVGGEIYQGEWHDVGTLQRLENLLHRKKKPRS